MLKSTSRLSREGALPPLPRGDHSPITEYLSNETVDYRSHIMFGDLAQLPQLAPEFAAFRAQHVVFFGILGHYICRETQVSRERQVQLLQ
jgi:hypothetical protein